MPCAFLEAGKRATLGGGLEIKDMMTVLVEIYDKTNVYNNLE